MKRTALVTTLALACALAVSPAAATSHGSSQAASQDQRRALTDGEVRKVDKEAKKITLRHGAIRNLEMPAMTMVFHVRDAALLDKVKEGDKVRFAADKIGDAITVTHLELTK
jgi:Cu(I)/Ag(I) efflux system protein CusF